MNEGGEISSSDQIYPAGIADAPVTPAKQGQSGSNLIQNDWLKSKFIDDVIQEASSKSFGFREGNLGSTSLMYDFNGGMYNRFLTDDVETWSRIPCKDLLALADATARKGYDGGGGGAGGSRSGAAVDISLQLGSNYHGGSNATDTRSQQCGWLNFSHCLSDLNLPPQMETEMYGSTGPSSQFTPVTPDQARREQKQMMIPNEDGRTNVAAYNNKDFGYQPQLIIEKPQADVFTFEETNQYIEKGLTEQTNLNETPQPKQRRRKHRPKVVTEGQPKRGKRSATPKVDGSSTGKRKYVRRKGIEKPTETPAGEEASGTIEPSTGQQTKKSCKRKITFDEPHQVAEVVVEKAQVEHTVDKTSSTSQAVKICQMVLERQSASPVTPNKTEPPQGRPIKDAEHTYRKAKCKINFLQETHDKVPSSVSSPIESNCSTSACFNKGEEAQGSKQGLPTKIDGMELWDENARACRESLEAYLSKYTDYNSGSKQCMYIPAIHKKDCIGKYQSSITATISSVSSARDSDCNFSVSATQNANKAPEKRKGKGIKNDQQSFKYMQASSHIQNSNKRTKAVTCVYDTASFAGMMDGRHHQTIKGASGYESSNKQRMFMEAHADDFQVSIGTKKRTNKSSMVSSLYNNHQCFTNHIGCHTNVKSKSIYEIDALISLFERLDINNQMAGEDRDALIPYSSRHHENNALVLYQRDGSIVPYEGLFNPIKKRKPRPKVDLDDETTRVWRLLLEDINSEGIDGTDEAKEKWWEEERRVFRGRADSFIARMHLVQGDRRFSRWKGSVLDSVIGVFLTQNVSDHLSSSAFMSLAARYPLKSNSSSEPLQEEEPILSVEEPCQVDQNETIGWHEKSNQPSGDHDPMMLQDADSFEEKVVNSNEFSKFSVDLNDIKECEVPELSEKDSAMYKESVVDQIEVDDIVSSQNSADTSPSSVQSSVVYTTERLRSCSMHNSEEQKDRSRATVLSGYPSCVELLHMQGSTTVHETYSQRQPDKSSNKKLGMDRLESMVYPEEQDNGMPGSNSSAETISTKEHELPDAGSSGALDVDLEPREETHGIQKKRKECSSEESGLSAESAIHATAQMVNTTSSHEATKSCNAFYAGLQETCHCEMIAENPKINTGSEQHKDNNCEVANVSAESAEATKSNKITEASGETVHKVVDFNANDNGTHQIVNGMKVHSSDVKKEKTGKKQIQVDWDTLRLQAEVKQKRERTPGTMDSLDYEAVRNADVSEVADTIKERGMNNVLAGRIKTDTAFEVLINALKQALLDRLVRDHGNTDLEWLRDVPPDKAKEYLLSFRGLGLKSVECVRLLTLHHLAFPVDTNVGRIVVRLGWVPLQPLPESLQLHLLELYPIMESIQKYLWPRLCKLDQRTLYELHYQMITFGKVFCTKSKPNCNACPMRGECRHFASAFASARLGLPAPEERTTAGLLENRTCQSPIKLIDQHQLPTAGGQLQQLAEFQNCNPVIEEPATTMPIVEVSATPGPIVEVSATPGPMVEVPATPGPIVKVPATPGPIVEVPATPEPIVEVPATPEPEHIQEFDIEDFCEDTEEIPMIKLNIEEFTQNLQTYMEKHMELGQCDMSKALVALTSEAAAIPTPKLKNVSQLRTEHQVYELPDSHPLLYGLDPREPDDPCSYLLAIWTPGETASTVQPPGGQCCSQESGTLCNEETCFFCNSTREANSQTVRGTLLIPCRTAMRGSFPLNGTYFQVNEVFADHESSLNPIDVPRSLLWNLPRRTVYFGTSIPTIFKGLTTEDIQYCFWRGFVCVRGFDQKTRAPRPLMARLHFPASKIKRSRTKTDES